MTSIHQRIAARKQQALNRAFTDAKATPIRLSHAHAPILLKVRSEKRWLLIVFTLMLVELGVILAYGMGY